MNKNFRYNFMLISLIIIIGVLVGTSNGFLLSSGVTEENTITDETQTDDNETSVTDGFTSPSSDASAYERIDFALNVLFEGQGFVSQISQEVKAFGSTQKIFIKQYRSGEYNLYERWLEASVSLGKFGFSSAYSDKNAVKYKEINSKNSYSFKDKTYNYAVTDFSKSYNLSDYISRYKNVNDFTLTINENTTSIVKYDKRTDPKYYIIKFKYDIAKIDKEYLNEFKDNGTDDLNYSSLVLTFKINKQTGFLSRIEKEEIYTTKYAGLPVSCNSKSVQTFTSMNVSALNTIQEIYSKSFANI